jgi:hypothetical protein
MAPDTLVTALKETEDLSLLFTKTPGTIQSGQKETDIMANKKAKKGKAVKANGEAKSGGRGPQFGDDAIVKRLKGPSDEQIKRHVTILSCLKEGGDKMTLAALGKALAKASGTKQDGVKVLRMHTKALTDGGFISVTAPSA